MLIIQANNIHEGGGKTLLVNVLNSLIPNTHETVVLFLDDRFDLNLIKDLLNNSKFIVNKVRPTLISRFLSEVKIRKLANENKGSRLFCFGNMPPIFSNDAKVVLFFQTVLYFEKFSKFVSGSRLKLKIAIEYFWIKSRLSLVDHIYVQSNSIKDSLAKEFGYNLKQITVSPFTDLEKFKSSQGIVEVVRDGFFYPAIGSPHKNHAILIDAWVILAKENIFPLLVLTIDSRYGYLLEHLEKAKTSHNIRVENLGLIPHDRVLTELRKSQAMIFPSYCESFGLPLLEARENNIQIIAGELDFVRDIVNPIETFDPDSALSVSRAIKRFLNISGEPIKIYSTSSFIDLVLKDDSGNSR